MTTKVFRYLILFIAGSSAAMTRNVVRTSTGILKGELVQEGNLRYYAYRGIPYAEKPTGNRRFMPPLAKTPWAGMLNATKCGKVCPQAVKRYTREQMSEDCLFLNVYVPATITKKTPVLAFVHGGEFKNLSGDDKLGALGFLSLDIKEASGNAGIKDVILALKWIKRNIAEFGGDSNKITLGGNSAGAGLAHLVLLTTKAKNLFNQAMLTSGSAFAYRFFSLHPKKNALALGRQLNLTTENTTELLINLRKTDAFDIVAAQRDMGVNDTRKGLRAYAPFVPSIEIEYNDAVITKTPIEIVRDGIQQNVPILAGFNSQEGIKQVPTIIKNKRLIDILNKNFELCIPSNIEYPYGSQQSKNLARKIRQFYFNGDNISNSTLHNFVDLVSETQFLFPIDSWIKLHKARDDSNVLYYYVFNFDGDLNFYKINNDLEMPGTAHADELGYLFKTKATAPLLDSIDTRTSRALDTVMSLLTNFIKFGDPTPEHSSMNYTWSPTGKERNYFIINDQPQNPTNSSYTGNLYFWYDVYKEYYEYVKTGGKIKAKVVP